MRWKSSPLLCSALLTCAAAAVLGAATGRGSAAHGAAALADRLPLHFEPAGNGFVARGRGAGFSVHASGIRMAGAEMRLAGADPSAQVEGVGQLPGRAHYLRGADPKQWRVDVPTYSATRTRNVYPGVDFVCYGPGEARGDTRLEYDLIVHPNASPEAIRLEFPGARRSTIESSGDLVLDTPAGALRQHRPEVYQVVDGKRRPVAARYTAQDRQIGFQVAAYDRSRPLVIDPVLSYSTYLGGSGNDEGSAIAIDAGGNIYVAGRTVSPDFPTQGAVQPGLGGGTLLQDAFITKLNPTGTTVLYSTYLGGSGSDNAVSLAVNSAGEVYVTGSTASTDFPRQNASQNTFRGGGSDAWAARLNAAGNALLYSTYLGGTGSDQGTGIGIDSLGNAVLCGSTDSGNFPTANALQAAHGGQSDAFVAKLNPSGVVQYATYLGANIGDFGMAVAVDPDGNAYVTGVTQSATFPVGEGGYDTTHNGKQDAFLVKLDPTGSTRLYGTFFGGSEDDAATSVAFDPTGTAYVVGLTFSANLPTAGSPVQEELGGGQDGFAARFNAAGTDLVYATYLGGSGTDFARDVAVDGEGFAYLTGSTFSADFPIAQPIRPSAGNFDAFAAKLRPDGSQLLYSTYVGGVSQDLGNAVAIDGLGAVFITGSTQSADFPLAAPLQASPGGAGDVFIAKITEGVAPPAVPTNLRVLAASFSQVDLAWNDNSDNELAFEIERKLGNSAFIPVGAVEADTTEFFDASVGANLVYSYRVRATNQDGASVYSNTVDAGTDAVPPLAPSSLAAEVLGPTSIKLTWTDNSGDENGFRIERAVGASQKFTTVGTSQPNTTTFTDEGLLAKTTYTYRVRATKEGTYSAPSNTDSETTPPNPPLAPANLTAVALSESQVKLTWSDASETETSFRIERKPGTATGAGDYTEIATVEANITSFTNEPLAPQATFTYRVRATNADGDSTPSNTATATTQPSPKGKLVVAKKLSFPKAVVNGFQTRTLVVRNASRTERLRITVNNPTAPYSILSGGGSSLLVLGGRKDIVLKFAPTAKGKFPGTLVITSSDPKRGTATVKLSGVGK